MIGLQILVDRHAEFISASYVLYKQILNLKVYIREILKQVQGDLEQLDSPT